MIVGPKIILRHPLAVSDLEEMGPGTSFSPVLDVKNSPNAKRVLLLSGKLYYELVAEREKRGLTDAVALVRVEELCPFPSSHISKVFETYKGAQELCWIQEEPQNQGAWTYMEPRLNTLLGKKV